MNIKLENLNNIDNLQSIGKFSYAKIIIGNKITLPIKARSWLDLLKIVTGLNMSVLSNKELLEKLLEDESTIRKLGDFKDAKTILTKKIGHKVTARSWKELYKKIRNIYCAWFGDNILSFDEKDKIYENIKYKNFVSSSKLENIDIIPVSESLDELENKYKAIGASING